MRIRKRWPPPVRPFAPDLLSPRPQLQPSLAASSSEESGEPRELHHYANLSIEEDKRLSPPSDLPNQSLRKFIGGNPHPSDLLVKQTNGWIFSTSERNQQEKLKKGDCMHHSLSLLQDSRVGAREKGTDEEKKSVVSNQRNGNNPGAKTPIRISASSSSSSDHQGGRWCEGDRAFPLKKRKGSFEPKLIMEEEKKMKTKMKSKTNKKWVLEEDDKEENNRASGHHISVKKKGSAGGVIMEGSRCSRVNGRGWRCCQQTLVGYSLCEHHLGKGRLRSMNSVRNRASIISTPKKEEDELLLSPLLPQESLKDEIYEEEEEDEDEKPLMIIKKRKKIGMIKARSISSLLGQTLHAQTCVSDHGNSYDNNISSHAMIWKL